MLRKCLVGLGVVLVIFLVLVGPTAVFWTQWMMPGNAFPEDIDAQRDSQGAAEPSLAARLEALLFAQRQASAVPSLSAAISRDGDLLWAGTVGYASIESKTPAGVDTLYRLGSTSKALTGTLLGRLMDAGIVTLDAKVGAYAPDLPEPLHAVSFAQLASHTGGVRHYSRMLTWLPAHHESITPRQYNTVEDSLELFVDDPLLFAPGSEFNYSTFGYTLLTLLLERATSSDFAALLYRHINTPLSVDLRLDAQDVEMNDRAMNYTTAKGRWGPAFPANPSYKWTGGGIVAKPTDLVRIGQALLGETFMAPETRGVLWTPVPVPGSETNPDNYGIGWRIDQSTRTLGDDRPVLLIHHGGTQMGGVAFWAIYPELKISVAVVSNTGERRVRGDVQDVAYALVREVVMSAID